MFDEANETRESGFRIMLLVKSEAKVVVDFVFSPAMLFPGTSWCIVNIFCSVSSVVCKLERKTIIILRYEVLRSISVLFPAR